MTVWVTSSLALAVAAFTDYVRETQVRLASSDPLFGGSHTASAELLAYHAEVARAFSIAISGEDIPLGVTTPEGDAVAGESADPSGTPDIEFTALEHDFGEVDQGDTVEHVFKFKNLGDADLVIDRVKSS